MKLCWVLVVQLSSHVCTERHAEESRWVLSFGILAGTLCFIEMPLLASMLASVVAGDRRQ